MKRLNALFLVAVFAFLSTGPLKAEPMSKGMHHYGMNEVIAVTGNGEVEASPDQATISAGVETLAPTARAAMGENSTAMNKLVKAIRIKKIEDRHIRTRTIDLQPVWSRPGASESGETASRITGYRASNVVTVTVTKIDKTADVLDAISGIANRIEGIGFSVADPAPLLDEARRKAVENAAHKAALFAQAAGVELGPVIRISETGHAQPAQEGRMMMRATAGAGIPVSPGTQTFSASINVTYGIKNDN